MKLYRILQLFLGKDLSERVPTYLITAKDDEDVYKWINQNIFGADKNFDAWADMYDDPEKKQTILRNKGDFHEDYMGEFYDIKYGWEEVCNLSEEDISKLNELNILEGVS